MLRAAPPRRAGSANAAAKLILLGEHAVVYGHPALAVPLTKPTARAMVRLTAPGRPITVELEDFGVRWSRGRRASRRTAPFAKIVQAALRECPSVAPSGWKLVVRSKIPCGCGLGSGAAVASAAFRAIFRFFGVRADPRTLSNMVYEIEKLHHGTPSGIDNTVIAMGRPVLFRKDSGWRFLAAPKRRFSIIVGHTGTSHRTADVVADVAKARAAAPAAYDAVFREIGGIARRGAAAFQKGRFAELGRLMDRNQTLLERIGVSSPKIDRLVAAARKAGALGAKLSGAGRGGCMAAITDDPACARRVRGALRSAGAPLAVVTEVMDHGAA